MLSISLFRLVCCVAGARWVAAQALTAWYTGVGAQVVYQNETTGALMYTINTGNDTATNGFTAWKRLAVSIQPMVGTSLTGTGYSDGQGNLFGQLFYQSRDGSNIVQALLTCSLPSATCVLHANNVISSGVTSGVNKATSLSATLRSANDGYRVFFHDTNGSLRQLNYIGPLNVTWGKDTPVINTTGGMASGIAADGSANLTVYGIDGLGHIITSRLANGTYRQTSAISRDSLVAWGPSTVSLQTSFSSDALSVKSLFYIGTDRSLHQLDSSNDWRSFSTQPTQPSNIWPLADKPNAPFALVSGGDSGSMFYMSGGNLVLVSVGQNGAWNSAMKVFTGNENASGQSAQGAKKSPALGNNAMMGILIGVLVGLVVLLAISVVAYTLIRRRTAKEQDSAKTAKDLESGEWIEYGNGNGNGNEAKPPVPDKDMTVKVGLSHEMEHSPKCEKFHELPSPSPTEIVVLEYVNGVPVRRFEKE